MKKILIPVKFEGMVEVEIPENVPTSRARPLAGNLVLARILATTDNPDAPEDVACEEYAEKFDLSETVAGKEWDEVVIQGVSGAWTLN